MKEGVYPPGIVGGNGPLDQTAPRASPRRQDHGSLDEVPEWFLEIGSERRIAGPGGVKKTDRRGKASRPGRR
jgi:hypothetical protein